GLPLGVLSALYRDSPIDHLARLVSLVGVSIPIFWLATVSLVVFYATLSLAPGPGRLGPQIGAPPSVTGFYVSDSLLAGRGVAVRPLASRAAGAGAEQFHHGPGHPGHALLDARGPVPGLHAHGACERVDRVCDRGAPCAAQRAHPHHHHPRSGLRRPTIWS